MPQPVAVPSTTALGDGIVQIRLPMTGNPLRHVNAYAVADDDGVTLVDCGWKAGDVEEALDEGLAEHGLALSDVRRVAITHVHHDHYGLAGTLRARSSAAARPRARLGVRAGAARRARGRPRRGRLARPQRLCGRTERRGSGVAREERLRAADA